MKYVRWFFMAISLVAVGFLTYQSGKWWDNISETKAQYERMKSFTVITLDTSPGDDVYVNDKLVLSDKIYLSTKDKFNIKVRRQGRTVKELLDYTPDPTERRLNLKD